MFMGLVKGRRSVRRFRNEPVARDLIEKCVEAARFAPSAENLQPWRFLVFDEPQLKNALAGAAFSGIYRVTNWASKAPVLVVVLAERKLATQIGSFLQGSQWWLLDVGIAGEHFVLQAQELGLGTCWIGWFNAKAVRRFLRLPRKFQVCYMLAVGWADQHPPPRPRKALSDILFYNRERPR